MKRLLTLILALSLSFSFCLPTQAQFSFQDDAVMEESTGDAEADSSGAADGEEEDDSTDEVSDASDEAEDDSSADDAAGSGDSSDDAAGDGDSQTDAADADTTEGNAAAYGVDQLKGAPDITAESAVVMDAASGAVLYGKEADSKQYPASITKVMTALLAVENCSMDDIVTFSSEAVNGIEPGSSSAGINVGAELTVEDTLYALMLVSANEAGAALAEHISGSDEAFADLMNQRAAELGCTGTHFTNPHGLPDEDHYTTAHDMALILRAAMQYDEFRKIAETDTYTLEKSDTLTDTLELWNHSKIIRENSDYYYEYAEGSKPGYTMAARNTLVTYAKKGNVELICTILKDYGADQSYYDTTDLFEWGFEQVKGIEPLSSFNLKTALEADSSIPADKITNIDRLNCTYPADYYLLVPADFDESTVKTSFTLDEDIHAGRVGYINITSGETTIGTVPVTYDLNSEAAQGYVSSGSADDNLETAPVDEGKITPGKVFQFIILIIVIVILAAILLSFLRMRQAEKRRQQRILERRKRHASSNTRSTGSYSGRSERDTGFRSSGSGRASGSGGHSGRSGSGSGRTSSSGGHSGRSGSGSDRNSGSSSRSGGSSLRSNSSGRSSSSNGRSGSRSNSSSRTSNSGGSGRSSSRRPERPNKR